MNVIFSLQKKFEIGKQKIIISMRKELLFPPLKFAIPEKVCKNFSAHFSKYERGKNRGQRRKNAQSQKY